MNVNVKIPLLLLLETINILESFNVETYDCGFQSAYENVLYSLRIKKESLALREAYSKIINAADDDTRHLARMQYLQQKRDLREGFL